MAKYHIRAPDGHLLVINGPDGASEADVMAQAQSLYQPTAAASAAGPRPIPSKSRADAEASFNKVGQGGLKPGQKGYDPSNPERSTAAMQGYTFNLADEMLGAQAAAGNVLGRVIGRNPGYGPKEAYNAMTGVARDREAAYRRDHPVESTANSLLGAVTNPTNVVGGEFIGGGATALGQVGRAAVVGGAAGAASGAGAGTTLGSRLGGAAQGAAIGAVVGGGLQAGGTALGAAARNARARPVTAARQLANQGVDRLTPGQIMGGFAQRAEDAATSIPGTGDMIRNAQRDSLGSFERAAYNQVLGPIGEALPPHIQPGRAAVAHTRQAVSAAYDRALGGVTVTADQQLGADLARLRGLNLRGQAGDELHTALDGIQQTMQNPVSGHELKALDEELGIAARGVHGGPGGRALQRALGEAQDALDGVLGRTSPEALAGKSAADEAWANLVRIETAAGSVGARGGRFSAPQLNAAVRSAEGGGRRSAAFARGDALMQGLTDPAMEVLPSTVPDSGTAFRSIMGAPVQALATGAVTAPVAAALYSRPAITAINAVYQASTPGAREAALAALSHLAAREPALIPVYQEMLLGRSGGQPPAQQEATR